MPQSIQSAVHLLLQTQKQEWPLAQKNFQALHDVEERILSCGSVKVRVQHNPARAISSGAKVDAKSIAERPCFLCAHNRPQEQRAIVWNAFEILINPFPIFHNHLTIPLREHQPQQLLPHLGSMMLLAAELPDFTIFYNGARCGASAPDHMHFQAGNTEEFPVVADFLEMRPSLEQRLLENGGVHLYCISKQRYLRTVWVLEGYDTALLLSAFRTLFPTIEQEEPLMNVLCNRSGITTRLFIFPRQSFRPWQYSAEGNERLMVSPATVELAGIIITPRKEDYEKITMSDVQSIYHQITWHEDPQIG